MKLFYNEIHLPLIYSPSTLLDNPNRFLNVIWGMSSTVYKALRFYLLSTWSGVELGCYAIMFSWLAWSENAEESDSIETGFWS